MQDNPAKFNSDKRNPLTTRVFSFLLSRSVHYRTVKATLFWDERPIVILAIDDEEKLRAALPIIVPMIKEGMINLVDTEVISTGASRPAIEKEQSQGQG